MTTRRFAVTWDYRCPFARNAHEHLLSGLAAGADWDVTFVPFSLGQAHVAEGDTPVWDEPERDSGLLALQVGVAVRDHWPAHFHAAHFALFAARHDQGKDLRDIDVITDVLEAVGLDAAEVLAEVKSGRALETIRDEHTAAAQDHAVWGVPTFIADGQSVFIRFMHRPGDDAGIATSTIERAVDLLSWADLNEFKHTSVPR
jgi:hypothetical protein